MYNNEFNKMVQNIINGTITDNAEKTISPVSFKIPMKDHQLKGLKRMEDLESRCDIFFDDIKVKTNMAVLCDKVGSGKSIMILGTICNNIVLNKLEDVHKVYVNSMYPFDVCVSKPKNNLSHRSNVIVVPKSIVQQWEKYILQFTNLHYIKLTTIKDLNNFTTEPDVILLTNNIHNDFAVKFRGHIFSRMIYDEVDSIRIPNTHMIDANFYWFVSASVTNIVYSRVNHVGFIKTSLSTLNSVNIEYLFVKNSDTSVDLSLQLPEPIIHLIKCKASNILNVLGGTVSEEVKLMISAGDISSALIHLNVFGCKENNIIDVVSFNLVKKLENEKNQLTMKNTYNFVNQTEKQKSIEKTENNIKELEEKINFIKSRIETTELDPISYEEIKYPVITKCCQNKFEFTTIFEYINLQIKKKKPVECPMCRTTGLSLNSLVYLKDADEAQQEVKTESSEYVFEDNSKYQNLDYLLQNKIEQNSKIMIMSEFENSFSKDCFDILDKHNKKYMSISTPYVQVENIIKKYKNNEISVLLMNARNFGAGINLENTDDIIVLHKMNHELEKQVIGRAQRLGRIGQLRVWKLNYTNE